MITTPRALLTLAALLLAITSHAEPIEPKPEPFDEVAHQKSLDECINRADLRGQIFTCQIVHAVEKLEHHQRQLANVVKVVRKPRDGNEHHSAKVIQATLDTMQQEWQKQVLLDCNIREYAAHEWLRYDYAHLANVLCAAELTRQRTALLASTREMCLSTSCELDNDEAETHYDEIGFHECLDGAGNMGVFVACHELMVSEELVHYHKELVAALKIANKPSVAVDWNWSRKVQSAMHKAIDDSEAQWPKYVERTCTNIKILAPTWDMYYYNSIVKTQCLRRLTKQRVEFLRQVRKP